MGADLQLNESPPNTAMQGEPLQAKKEPVEKRHRPQRAPSIIVGLVVAAVAGLSICKELLLLMNVSVLKSPFDASAQVANEKAKLPGISEADKEFKKTEEQSLKKAGLPPNK